jgi:hypothetical protein
MDAPLGSQCTVGESGPTTKGDKTMQIVRIGLDIAKNVLQVHGVNAQGKVGVQKQLSRSKVLAYFTQLPACRIGREACGSAHYWGRALQKLGHDVRLMAVQLIKPYRTKQKNDRNDAEAICEAVSRPQMRFVPIKTVEQQAVLTVHRPRDSTFTAGTACRAQCRGRHPADAGAYGGDGRGGQSVPARTAVCGLAGFGAQAMQYRRQATVRVDYQTKTPIECGRGSSYYQPASQFDPFLE